MSKGDANKIVSKSFSLEDWRDIANACHATLHMRETVGDLEQSYIRIFTEFVNDDEIGGFMGFVEINPNHSCDSDE